MRWAERMMDDRASVVHPAVVLTVAPASLPDIGLLCPIPGKARRRAARATGVDPKVLDRVWGDRAGWAPGIHAADPAPLATIPSMASGKDQRSAQPAGQLSAG